MLFRGTLTLFLVCFGFYQISILNSENTLRSPANHNEIQGKYGPEFSFTNEEIIEAMKSSGDSRNPVNFKWLEKWGESLIKLCRQHRCEVEETRDSNRRKAFRVVFSDGWWFQVGVDVGCLEVQAKASTYKTFKTKKNIMEAMIFSEAKKIGLAPHTRIGGGHLNMDLRTAFNRDAVLFRNFIVDRANHPELVWGIFGGHLGNAPPIAALELHLHSEFDRIIQDFDKDPKSQKRGVEGIQGLAHQIQQRVYVSNPLWLAENKKKWDPDYYQDMNLRNLRKNVPEWLQRLELRGMKPQQNLNEFFLQMEYMDSRLNYLNRLEQPLRLQIPTDYEMSIEEKKENFLRLIEETGLSKKKFAPFLKGPIATGRVRSKGLSCRSLIGN